MYATFSTDTVAGMPPAVALERVVRLAYQAADPGYLKLKWARDRKVCFRLLDCLQPARWQPASTQFHDRVIAALYDLDPQARIETGRAIYESREDYRRQLQASLVPE